jgi:DNA-binding transcriptional regulator LsrR (DeoR family)
MRPPCCQPSRSLWSASAPGPKGYRQCSTPSSPIPASAWAGVVGEISGVLIDRNGREVITPLSKRIIGITGQQLAGIKVVLGIAYGQEKADAVRSALAGGLVTSLVTHAALARRLIDSNALRA